jgi:hypothetical protein
MVFSAGFSWPHIIYMFVPGLENKKYENDMRIRAGATIYLEQNSNLVDLNPAWDKNVKKSTEQQQIKSNNLHNSF